MSAEELAALCLEYRRKLFNLPSVVRRGLDFQANCRNPVKAALYVAQSLSGAREVNRRQGLPLGFPEGAG